MAGWAEQGDTGCRKAQAGTKDVCSGGQAHGVGSASTYRGCNRHAGPAVGTLQAVQGCLADLVVLIIRVADTAHALHCNWHHSRTST